MSADELKNLIIYTGVYMPPEGDKDRKIYENRSPIWFETFDNAQRLGIKLVVRNDGGLPEEMVKRIKGYENITIVEKTAPNTLGGGRRETLQKAINIAKEDGILNPVFLWTEPEKDDLITEKALLPLVREVNAGTNIAVAERKEEAWAQLPPFQRWIERRANKRANQAVPQDSDKPEGELDFWFAPRAFDKTGAKYFLAYNSDKGRLDLWDAIFVPIIDAIKAGEKVRGVPLDFLYNEIQINNESDESNREIKIKRMEQYAQILKELGDKKWEEFFEDSKAQLEEIKKINKENPEDKTELLKEAKKSLWKNVFRLK